jgi:imidazolonepropionase-like amidohydrolase
MKTVIHATVLFDGKSRLEDVYIVIEGDKIIEVTKNKLEANFSGIVTPAFIDAHSHIGMFRHGEPEDESEGNDFTDQIKPLNHPLNSIYFDDAAFSDAIDFGVLYSCVVPGSGNLIGGRSAIIKNYAKSRNEALLKEHGFKMALGYNPRSTESWKGTRPNTRMGIYSLLEARFDALLDKKEKKQIEKEKKLLEVESKIKENKLTSQEAEKEKNYIQREFLLEFDSEEKALLEILIDKKPVKVHVHKEDDVEYLITLAKKYDLNILAEHLGDVHHREIFDQLAQNNIPIVYGPLGTLGYKVELKHEHYQNAKLLMDSNAFYGLMTDNPFITAQTLRETLKYFLIHGMKEEDAISIITYKNAKILGIDDMLGTVEAGKLASLVVWDQNPLNLAAFPKCVMAEGKVLRG